MNAVRILLPLCLGLVAGCAERATATDLGRPDAGPRVDAQQPPPGGPWTFVPEDDGKVSPAIALRPGPAASGPGSLLLVARGVPKLQGIAFRLEHDAASLKAGKLEVAPGWYGSGKDLIARIAARAPGEIWGGIGYSGSHGLDASGEVTLAHLELVPGAGAGPIPVRFKPGRNLVIDANAAKVAVSWRGGRFERAP